MYQDLGYTTIRWPMYPTHFFPGLSPLSTILPPSVPLPPLTCPTPTLRAGREEAKVRTHLSPHPPKSLGPSSEQLLCGHNLPPAHL